MTATATRCACSSFVAVATDGTTDRLVCTQTTKRTFAPGHDAKLKGFLIRAGRAGLLISTEQGNVEPTAIADLFGFGHMVRDGIKRVAPVRKAKKAAAPVTVQGKVGRWVYEGTLTAGGRIFSYTDRKGNHLMAEKFTIVG
jgi:hypothetical protein